MKKKLRDDEPAPEDESSGKTVIRVRRGALRRFDLLKQKSTGLPVDIKWDRRLSDRRSDGSDGRDGTTERRRDERRQAPPFTWDIADFVVVGDRSRPSDPSSAPVEPGTTVPDDAPAKDARSTGRRLRLHKGDKR